MQVLTSQEKGRRHLLCALILAMGVVVALGACTVPKHMLVDTGLHPKNQDKDVRFRTTYYFRVFDYCADPDKQDIKVPFAIDSLYRFRMTGKAHALSNQVHFESGTLTAGQIDPFGANVAFDKENGQFYFKSQHHVQQEVARERQFAELERLLEEYHTLRNGLVSPPDDRIDPEDKSLLDDFREVIKQQITQIKGVPVQGLTLSELEQFLKSYQEIRAKIVGQPDELLGEQDRKVLELLDRYHEILKAQISSVSSSPTLDTYCQNLRRGFQILGPEGWRTFNQDDRLVMAMTSSGKPLISTLQEISGRILNNQPIEAEVLLPLVEEDLRLTRTEHVLDTFDPEQPGELPSVLKRAFDTLEE